MRLPIGLSLLASGLILLPSKVLAHCPLCTIGAGAAAAGAAVLGVKSEVIGVLIGAFAVALGLFFASRVKKRFVPGQAWLIVAASFLLTVVPLVPLLEGVFPVTVYWFGELGTAFNSVYLINRFLFGSLLGGLLMAVSPLLSGGLTNLLGGRRFPYQGLAVTFAALALASMLLQLYR
jgi:hypothetical protein